MNLKEKLLKLRKNIILLDDKINSFINYIEVDNDYESKEIRNFIEKMVVWYELRYPEYEINRLFTCCGQEPIDINEVMFINNEYINDLSDEKSDIRKFKWSEFYNAKAFINSLPWQERKLVTKPIYNDIVYIQPNLGGAHLHLTKDGIVEMSEYIGIWTCSIIKDNELEGLHVKEVVELFKKRGIALPENNELEETIKIVDKRMYFEEQLLDSVMYRIIERGGNRIGPRRAFLFAKEFDRNIDIPMMYAVDRSDPGLRSFMNEYIKSGGNKNLECYVGYFSNINKNKKLDTISIQDLILTQKNNTTTFYTPEEEKLHQKIVNLLASQINYEELQNEKEKQLKR